MVLEALTTGSLLIVVASVVIFFTKYVYEMIKRRRLLAVPRPELSSREAQPLISAGSDPQDDLEAGIRSASAPTMAVVKTQPPKKTSNPFIQRVIALGKSEAQQEAEKSRTEAQSETEQHQISTPAIKVYPAHAEQHILQSSRVVEPEKSSSPVHKDEIHVVRVISQDLMTSPLELPTPVLASQADVQPQPVTSDHVAGKEVIIASMVAEETREGPKGDEIEEELSGAPTTSSKKKKNKKKKKTASDQSKTEDEPKVVSNDEPSEHGKTNITQISPLSTTTKTEVNTESDRSTTLSTDGASLKLHNLKDVFKTIRNGLSKPDEEEDINDEDIKMMMSEPGQPMSSTLSKTRPPTELLISNELDAIREITGAELGSAKVVRFDSCKRCEFLLPASVGPLIKVFVEGCEDMSISIECRIVTRHVEVARCERLEMRIKSRTDTLQVDLSKDVKILCDKNSCRQIYHAGVSQLQVCTEDSETCVIHDYLLDDPPLTTLTENGDLVTNKPSQADQYLTRIAEGGLKTEKVALRRDELIPRSVNVLNDTCSIKGEDEEDN